MSNTYRGTAVCNEFHIKELRQGCVGWVDLLPGFPENYVDRVDGCNLDGHNQWVAGLSRLALALPDANEVLPIG